MRIHRPHIPITLFYLGLLALSFAAYHYLQKLPEARGVISAQSLWQPHGNLFEGLGRVWFIFAWGFGIQTLVQISRVFRRHPRDADIGPLLKHGAWVSAHAGLFEELIFRLYAFLSFIIVLLFLNARTGSIFEWTATHAVLPAANFITFGLFNAQFDGTNWAFGIAVILGSLFFRSAHIHYGALSKANVWFIGMVMFWLLFNYGLLAAIAAHFLYDLCVFTAIALTSPLQPRQ